MENQPSNSESSRERALRLKNKVDEELQKLKKEFGSAWGEIDILSADAGDEFLKIRAKFDEFSDLLSEYQKNIEDVL